MLGESAWYGEEPVDWRFLDVLDLLVFEDPPEFVFLGMKRIFSMGVNCKQFMVNKYVLDSLITIERVLPRSSYTIHAKTVRYARFMIFFIRLLIQESGEGYQ